LHELGIIVYPMSGESAKRPLLQVLYIRYDAAYEHEFVTS